MVTQAGHLVLLDQTLLPSEVVEIDCRTVEDVWQAIKTISSPRGPGKLAARRPMVFVLPVKASKRFIKLATTLLPVGQQR